MRATCRRCLRPEAFCVCAGLGPIPSRTRVVLLQHPREARLAICSAWLTRVALENAELHRGVRFEDEAHVRMLAARPRAALLFPGEGATPAGALAADPPEVLVVIDGTWLQAEKMLAANPSIAALRRVALSGHESGYGALRREPADGHLSTIEAVAHALGALERDPARFAPMVRAFRRMVELQLRCSEDERRRPRHRAGRGAEAA
ncbi:MAG TPA: tRNA-uridine aminocarboxypropyltransferase [Anaeromyxobacter sp.]|nr:tRNA-uridine aminocarboxypropyltransferase [Anaeromyxobacter sp.]